MTNPAIHEEISPRYPLEPDELDDPDVCIGERAAPRSVDASSPWRERADDRPAELPAFAKVTSLPASRLMLPPSCTKGFFEEIARLEQERDTLKLSLRDVQNERDRAVESERVALNETKAMLENLSAVQARCTTLLDAHRDSKVIDAFNRHLADDKGLTSEPLKWQLLSLGAEKSRLTSSPTVLDHGAAVGLAFAAMVAGKESAARSCWLRASAIALGLASGDAS